MRFAPAPLWLGLIFSLSVQHSSLRAQTSAFTYQGRLSDGGGAASGIYDLRFTIYDEMTGGNVAADPITRAATSVSNGLFTATLDFGSGVFDGTSRWLEVSVRTNGGGAFTRLSPRQAMSSTPHAIFANTASNFVGAVPLTQLPTVVLTNNESGVSLSGTFGGNGGALTNLSLSGLSTQGPNRIQSVETSGSELLNVLAGRDLRLEANLDATFSSGRDVYINAASHLRLSATGNATFTIYNSFEQMVGMTYQLTAGQNVNLLAGGNLSLSGNSLFINSDSSATLNVASQLHSTVSGDVFLTVGDDAVLGFNDDLAVQANDISISSSKFTVLPTGTTGLGTGDPQAQLHVYSPKNPTVLRVQSAGTPGFGRLEFFSDPQGSVNEWRPGYIQSTDNGGFTGGLAFVVNGTGAGQQFGEVETMRIVNGRVGIGTTSPQNKLHVVAGATGNAVQGTSADPIASGVYGENLGSGYGVAGRATFTGTAIYGDNPAGWAGYFNGNVRVTGVLNNTSDRNAKRDFKPVDTLAVLDKLASLQIQTWTFTNDATGSRHLGPVAQEFKAAFGLGADDTSIATVDADGVALAAIQALNQKVEQQRSELRAKDERLAALERELAEIKQLLQARK
jgi:hypothetical protein